MQALINGTSIVLAGAWNLAVLSPEWIRVRLLNNIPSVKVQFSIGIDSNFRIDTDDLYINTTASKIIIGLNDESEKSEKQMIEIADMLIDLWSCTPLQAVGYNFEFISDEGQESYEIPILNDDAFATFSEKGWNRIKIERTYLITPTQTVNYSLTSDGDGKFSLNANFDYKCKSDFIKTTRENLGIDVAEEYYKCRDSILDLSKKYQ